MTKKSEKPWKMVKIDGELFTVPTKFAPMLQAAPELLAALKSLSMIAAAGHTPTPSLMAEVNAAIAKATEQGGR